MTDDDDDLPLLDWTIPPPPAGLVDRIVDATAAAPRPAVAREAYAPPRSGLKLAILLFAAGAGGAAVASAFWAAAYQRERTRAERAERTDRATGEPSYVRPPVVHPLDDQAPAVARPDNLAPLPPPVTSPRKVSEAERRRLLAALDQARQLRIESATASGGASAAAAATLDPDAIQTAIREVVPLLAECFDLAPADLRKAGGRVVTELTVQSEPDVGTLIADARFLSGTDALLTDADFSECVTETLYSVQLPALPDDAGTLTIHYPFVFSSD